MENNSIIVGQGLSHGIPYTNVHLNDMSAAIGEIALALSKVQEELESASKDTKGYGYKYSDLSSVIATAKPLLAKNGLAITQLLGNSGDRPSVTTILTHKSGQYFRSNSSMPLIDMKGCNTAQAAGAVISYLRRYAYQAILGMSSEDTDASSNSGSTKSSFTKPKVAAKPNSAPSGQRFRKKKEEKVSDDEI